MDEPKLTLPPKVYEPQGVEKRLTRFWLDGGYFTPRIRWGEDPFVIIMPPPNVTGELHLGHALTAAIEDIMVRWHRMKGDPTLWLPGTDHSGIAAQVVVERALAKEGLTRHDLGRDKLFQRMQEWAKKYRQIIAEQHRSLGASCDWTRERFTMDAGPSRAVRTTFVRLFNKGLIYRGERLVNWCLRCSTVLSDLEVEHLDRKGKLYYVIYPLATGEHITVATTRPETILGDTAVAVHPEDGRYKGLVGQQVILPAIGRHIPIVADEAVDPSFGTGMVKITPAHDPVDFEIAQRRGLPAINVMNLDGTMNENAGIYAGLDRLVCREKLLADLQTNGLLERVEDHSYSVGHCHRCKEAVEPLISKQWFVRMDSLAKPALEAVQSGRIRILPERFTKVYINWIANIRDWCISRQIWWGHRIPVWYCQDCPGITVVEEDPSVCGHCGGRRIHQDPDVLDTWFSSALWPHSTLGWPDDTDDLRYFYPTSVLETGYDIIFFWVARMIMMGIENMGEIPFRTVYLHGLVRTNGEKMSKSKGNVTDPLVLTSQYGTDALRFSLTTGTTPGNDVSLNLQKLEAGRNFANKLWNAARYVLSSGAAPLTTLHHRPSLEHRVERWIWSRLNRLVGEANGLMGEFQWGEAEKRIHDFFWGEFCDWYIEITKIVPGRPRIDIAVLEVCLRLLHPFMPFITEEIWQRIVSDQVKESIPSITIAPYPVADESALDPETDKEMGLILELVRSIRNARAEMKVEPARWMEVVLAGGKVASLLEEERDILGTLSRSRPLRLAESMDVRPLHSIGLLVGGVEIYLSLDAGVDFNAEVGRIAKEIEAVERELSLSLAKLADDQFLQRAPAVVIEKERGKLQDCQNKRERLTKWLQILRSVALAQAKARGY
ncbi:MAG: valine--tRNA ligase [Chloroflexi bacterium]|nr:valine--tRNA ligase [Chloroflexota bacterium]